MLLHQGTLLFGDLVGAALGTFPHFGGLGTLKNHAAKFVSAFRTDQSQYRHIDLQRVDAGDAGACLHIPRAAKPIAYFLAANSARTILAPSTIA